MRKWSRRVHELQFWGERHEQTMTSRLYLDCTSTISANNNVVVVVVAVAAAVHLIVVTYEA